MMTSTTQPDSSPAAVSHADLQSQLFIYDSMSGQKRRFEPINKNQVGLYVCGMTIYDYCHIGHARLVVAFDAIVRWLRQIGYQVNYVRNITDIDDKIINRAIENNETTAQLTERFIKIMVEDMSALGCMPPDREPRATEYIDDMQQMIGQLVNTDFAYAADNGDVYYAVDKFEGYGKLSGRKLDDMQAGSRVSVDSKKRNPFDFVLWKAAKPDEPKWHSPWGNGRPGWHIECSAMSQQCLGDTFDIHGGGHDLLFPHHENEIAQSEAVTGCTYANNWMHVGFINVDGEKMSKSLGNFFTIQEVRAKYHPEVIRFFILSSHYRSQVNFSTAALDDALAALSRFYQALRGAQQLLKNKGVFKENTHKQALKAIFATQVGKAFAQAMNDDFNTVAAINVMFALTKELNKAVRAEDIKQSAILSEQLTDLGACLNILQHNPVAFLQADKATVITEDTIAALIDERIQAKKNKDFARADAIREKLQAQGVELEDGKQGTTWRRSH